MVDEILAGAKVEGPDGKWKPLAPTLAELPSGFAAALQSPADPPEAMTRNMYKTPRVDSVNPAGDWPNQKCPPGWKVEPVEDGAWIKAMRGSDSAAMQAPFGPKAKGPSCVLCGNDVGYIPYCSKCGGNICLDCLKSGKASSTTQV